MNTRRSVTPIAWGAGGILALLALYFATLTLVSGWEFARSQFADFWYFIVALAAGFGIQVGLYIRLRHLAHASAGKGAVAVSGTTSTAAMISCCAHYLANVLPVLGATGIVVFVSQYQVELFWIGIAANLIGIVYIAGKIKTILASRGSPPVQTGRTQH